MAWAKTADTSVYAELLGNAGMCASVGNILNAPAAPTATTTGSGSAQATVTSAKATSSSSASNLERNVGCVFGAQVSCSKIDT